MKKTTGVMSASLIVLLCVVSYLYGRQSQNKGYILEHDLEIGKSQPPPHNGIGMSTAYSYFTTAPGLKLTFRKRALKPGSAIGYHYQQDDEIYYIESGTGIMTMNNDSFPVKAGDGILTRPGSSHGLRQTGNADLVVIINYLSK